MKKLITFVLLVALLLVSCNQEEEITTYNSTTTEWYTGNWKTSDNKIQLTIYPNFVYHVDNNIVKEEGVVNIIGNQDEVKIYKSGVLTYTIQKELGGQYIEVQYSGYSYSRTFIK